MESLNDLPIFFFTTDTEWEKWLAKHHTQTTAVWAKLAKKASGVKSITYEEALNVALCYGWIDNLGKSYDETYHLVKFTPRRLKSNWSAPNIARVEKLIARRKMKPAGLATVEAAKIDGRWGKN